MRGQPLSVRLLARLIVPLLLTVLLAACSQVRDSASSPLDPISDFQVTPLAGDAPLLVTLSWLLDASVSHCEIRLGDGSTAHVPTDCRQGSLDHTFSTPGTYTVTFEAESGGASFERVVTVNVTDRTDPSQNHSPTITSFTANPTSGTAPLPVALQWLVADPDGDALTCRVITGDGAAPAEVTDCANDTTFAYTFSSPGTYNVQLIVSDGRGGSANRAVTVTVTDAGGGVPSNEDPKISGLTVTPTEGLAPLNTTIAWSISDADGDALSCHVDFGDGSGQVVNPCTDANDVDYTYTTPGHYTITLTVSDGKGGSATRNGAANVTVLPAVVLSTGTSLLSVDSADAPLLDAVASALVGSPIAANVVGWDALVGTSLPIMELVDELETVLGVTGIEDVLDAGLSLEQLLAAVESVLSGTPAAGELADLRNELLGITGPINLDALFDLDSIAAPELDTVLTATNLNVLDLVLSSLQLHAFLHADPAAPLQVALPTSATLTTVDAVSATVSVTSPPQLLLARSGTTFSTAGMRLHLEVDLIDLDSPLSGPVVKTLEVLLSVPLLPLLAFLDVGVELTDLEVYLDFAPGSGTVVGLEAAPSSVTVNLVPGVVEVRLGKLTTPDRGSYFGGAPLSGLAFTPSVLGAVDLSVRSIATTAEIGAVDLNIGALASAGTAASSAADVTIDAFPGVAVRGVSATAVQDLATSLLGSTELSLTVGTSTGPIDDLVALLTTVLSNVLGALTDSLADLVADLPLSGVLSEVVGPLVEALGGGLGEMTVTGRQLVSP